MPRHIRRRSGRGTAGVPTSTCDRRVLSGGTVPAAPADSSRSSQKPSVPARPASQPAAFGAQPQEPPGRDLLYAPEVHRLPGAQPARVPAPHRPPADREGPMPARRWGRSTSRVPRRSPRRPPTAARAERPCGPPIFAASVWTGSPRHRRRHPGRIRGCEALVIGDRLPGRGRIQVAGWAICSGERRRTASDQHDDVRPGF